jgi:glycosyl transferase family 25
VKGVKGCFLSHFLLWKKCLELNKPILILEHDALAIRELPKDILDYNYDILNLDYASRQIENYWEYVETDHGLEILSWEKSSRKGYGGYNKSSIPGIHGYIIKPSGAEKLIKFSKQQGTLPADIQINSLVVDLKYTKTSYVKINPKYWLLANVTDNRSKPGSPESLTVKDW